MRSITLVYDVDFGFLQSGEGWNHEYTTDTLTYLVSRTNIQSVLDSYYYRGYPLMLDVSSWEINAPVNVGEHAAIVVNETTMYGYDCWTCHIDENIKVYYDKDTGLFVHYNYYDSGVTGFVDLWIVSREITLSRVDYAGLYAVEIKQTGIILAAIFAELSIITWLIANRLMKKDD